MSDRLILGLTGPIGSGKSTCAQWLQQAGWKRVPFAGPLKEMLRALGLTEAELNGSLKETPCDLLMGCTPRRAMQTLGTEWGRALNKDLWLHVWKQWALPYSKVVVDDVRFPNEAELLQSLGGKIIKIVRQPQGVSTGDHVSELHFNRLPFDRVVFNYGSLEDLQYTLGANIGALFP